MSGQLLIVEDLVVKFRAGRASSVVAVDGISFDIAGDESVGIVGESGSGKTTLGRSLSRLVEPTSGRIVFDGQDITNLSPADLQSIRRSIQFVFQDPASSLNPRWPVRSILAEAIRLTGVKERDHVEMRVRELLGLVGLPPSFHKRRADEMSGGQQQRVAIARAVATEPKLLVLDEPTSALDASSKSRILSLVGRLREQLGLSYIFISHDLSAVGKVCDRVLVMYLGRVVEQGPTQRLLEAPMHPYTRSLLSSVLPAVPGARRERIRLRGEVANPAAVPAGCRFHPRCPIAEEACSVIDPNLQSVAESHSVACTVIARNHA